MTPSTIAILHRAQRAGAVIMACAALLVATDAAAQAYPSRVIRFVVPQSPGSSTDTVARMIGTRLAEKLGQPVVADNRPGAGGIIGADLVAKAAPDGYSIVIVSATHTVNPSLRRGMPFDAVADFAPVTLATAQGYVLISHPSLPVRNVRELAALARAHPGQINYASSAAGSLGHLGLELLKSTAHINMVHVPYKGIIPALTDVVGGHVSLMFSTLASGMPPVRAGKLRALAVSSAKRIAIAPDVPTVAESGFPGYEVSGWYGILAPAHTPAAIVSRLNTEIVAILQSAAVKERLAKDSTETIGSTPEFFGTHLKSEVAKWGKVVKTAGITAE